MVSWRSCGRSRCRSRGTSCETIQAAYSAGEADIPTSSSTVALGWSATDCACWIRRSRRRDREARIRDCIFVMSGVIPGTSSAASATALPIFMASLPLVSSATGQWMA